MAAEYNPSPEVLAIMDAWWMGKDKPNLRTEQGFRYFLARMAACQAELIRHHATAGTLMPGRVDCARATLARLEG